MYLLKYLSFNILFLILCKIFYFRYIYGGKLFLGELDTSDVIKILFAARELSLQELLVFLQSYLIKNKADWMKQNFDLIYITSFENNSFLDLQKYCIDLITKEPNKIFKLPNFSSIPENLLISIIQNENLQINLLKTFLSLLDPNRRPVDESNPHITKNIELRTVDSKIITYQHAELISKWIDRLDITTKLTSPCKFNLIFRGSRDGLTRNKFHETCNDKVKDSNEILGGYNPIAWKTGGGYDSTKDSFIFSFNSRIEYYILSRVLNETYATFNVRRLLNIR
ncbi:hypothetical protein C1645_842068 [Glomus cerebriforme]|uniref:TLDc domain-containing protein n=1 Tax=Glomus cerebriforme TaxID=658196 RepID=A0A397S284_9GLOM|nr:hypothetical protein C1645_842068 [Glomus cerebriforme]